MKTYAIFYDDMEIHVSIIAGTLESIENIRGEITETIKGNPTQEHGYVEQYPFYQAEWEVFGYALPVGFDVSTILKVN